MLLLLSALFLPGPSPAGARSCQVWGSPPSPNVGADSNVLNDVAVVSSCRAWAVGHYYDTGLGRNQNLILRWDGTEWSVVESPNRGSQVNELLGVAAVSASDVWAVGYSGYPTSRSLVLHWNGAAWSIVKSPNPSDVCNDLFGITATSASNVWAVGERCAGSAAQRVMIQRWNGTAWRVQRTPDLAGDHEYLLGVAARSSTNAWAVGGTQGGTLALRWNGSKWVRRDTPNGPAASLEGVAVTGSGIAWAVGTDRDFQPMIVRWNGRSWKRQPSPGAGDYGGRFHGVVAASATNAIAVGDSYGMGGRSTLIVHWNGTAWIQERAPASADVGANSQLRGVDLISANDAWAVGFYEPSVFQTLILHCC
jgi:hypothetical protein